MQAPPNAPSPQRVDDDLWTIARPFRTFGLELGTRTTLVRTRAGLVAHSPCPLDAALIEAVRGLGPVGVLVAPSLVHHLFVGQWAEAFPEAKVVAAPGLAKKRGDLRIDATLGEDDPGWGTELEPLLYEGAPLMNEVVLHHPRSRTLLLTDLAFNIRTPVGWWTRSYLKLSDAYLSFGQSWVVKAATRDKARARDSVARFLSKDFDRITVTHGEVLETGGPDTLRSIFSWL